jgi:peroxiredoxin/mono/diheme cytochrome c family protein
VHNLLRESEGDLEIGERFHHLSFRTLDGQALYVADLCRQGPVAFVFTSTTCPLAKRYIERLKRIDNEFGPRGATLIGVFSNAEDTRESVRKYAELTGFSFPLVKDDYGYLARQLGASMTPQVLVLDQRGVLRYRGAIDDNRVVTRVKERFLHAALTAILDGKSIERAQVPAMGCTIHLPTLEETASVTYSGQIARVLQTNCATCHREGQVAPFSLTTYDEARTWATEIQQYTQNRLMPPWKPDGGFGEFRNSRALTDEEISLIARWVEGGAAEGDPSDLPPPPRFNDQWSLGEPDLVVEMPEEYVIGPEGEDDYRHFIISTQLERDMYVEAIDVQPGNRNTVHHVIAYVDTNGVARKLDARDPGPGYTNFGGPGFQPASMLGGWAPGSVPDRLPPGTGRWLPQESDIVLQVHYYRTGVEERDRTRVGLYFSNHPRPVKVHTVAVINRDFVIPAGEETYDVQAEWPAKRSIYVLETFPHMHLLGRSMKTIARLPDGQQLPLIRIKDWDFNWQQWYAFSTPILLPRGSVVELEATFDNSPGNPNNPHDPPRDVGWGEKTTDEMCLNFLSVVDAEQFDGLRD